MTGTLFVKVTVFVNVTAFDKVTVFVNVTIFLTEIKSLMVMVSVSKCGGVLERILCKKFLRVTLTTPPSILTFGHHPPWLGYSAGKLAFRLMSALVSGLSKFLGVSFLAMPGSPPPPHWHCCATTASDSLEELSSLLGRLNS